MHCARNDVTLGKSALKHSCDDDIPPRSNNGMSHWCMRYSVVQRVELALLYGIYMFYGSKLL
jgi:hypothetical protein